VSEALPKHLAGVGDGGERGHKKQNGQNCIDDHFGFAEVAAKVDAKLFFGHLSSLAETDWLGPVDRQSIATSGFIGKRERVRTHQ